MVKVAVSSAGVGSVALLLTAAVSESAGFAALGAATTSRMLAAAAPAAKTGSLQVTMPPDPTLGVTQLQPGAVTPWDFVPAGSPSTTWTCCARAGEGWFWTPIV